MKPLVYLLFCIVVCSCQSRSFNDKDAFLSYLNNPKNGYTQQKNVSGIEVSLTLLPTEFVLSQLNGMYSQYIDADKFVYLKIGFSMNGKEILSTFPQNKASYSSLSQTLSFDLMDKLILTSNRLDTLKKMDYNFFKTYGMSDKNTALVVFKNDSQNKMKDVRFKIQEFGLDTGDISFNISDKIINQQPKLKK